MKIIKIVLISLLALIALVFVAAIVIINTVNVNKYKPQIIAQADKALARHVDFSNARLGIGLNGIGLRIEGLTVSEDPAFGTGEFLNVKSLSIGVDLLGYLLKRQVSITSILIETPKVTIIRTKEGAINAQSIAQPSGGQPAPAPAGGASSAALPALLIASLKGQNGTVTYIDHSFEPPITLEADDVGFTVNKLSLFDPFPFSVQASVLGTGQNIRVEGKCQIDMKNFSARIFDLTAGSDLSRLALAEIPRMLPMVPAQAMPSELKGTVDVNIPVLVAGAKGLSEMNGRLMLSNGLANFKEMRVPVKDITKSATITEKDITLDSFSAAIGEGGIKGSGWVKNYGAGQDFSFDFSAEKLSLEDLVAPGLMPVKAAGLIAAKGQVKGHGFTPDALRSNLAGEATVTVAQAKLKELNVLNAVLDQLAVIPGLGESIRAGLPEKYQEKLQQKDTVFSDVTIPLSIANGRVIINETSISSEDLFTFKGKGEAGFDGQYSLEGSFLLSQDFSKAMVSSVKQTQYLLNEEQMIFIPLKVSGSAAAKMQISVDTGYVTKKLLENQARQQILKGLDKYLGGKQESTQSPPSGGQGQGSPQSQQGTQQNDTQEVGKAVDKLLKGIFK